MAPIVAGDGYRFQLVALKDNAVWNLTAATVTLNLVDPDGVTHQFSATVTDAAAGTAAYSIGSTDIDTAGVWRRYWTITASGVSNHSEPEDFLVVEAGT